MWCVYKHVRSDTGDVVYYGCGSLARAQVSKRNRRSAEHRKLQDTGVLYSVILATFSTLDAGLKLEEECVAIGRLLGHPLFNKVSGGRKGSIEKGVHAGTTIRDLKVGIFRPGAQREAGRISGKVNGPRAVREKTGIHSEAFSEERRLLGIRNGKLPWWHNPATKETKRAAECPEGGFIRGRGSFSWSTRP